MTRLLCISLALALAISRVSRGADAAADATTIDGTWLPAAAELAGEKFPDDVRQTIRLVIADGKYTVTVGQQVDKGVTKLDPSTKPKSLDVIGTDGPNKGKTILAIYELSPDTLQVCYDLTGKARPTEFKTTKGSLQFLVTYKRAKP